VGSEKIGPVIYRGTSHTLKSSSIENGLTFSILNGRRTSFPAPQAGLVSALQARNNARVVFSGSLDLFSDRFFNARVASNDGKVKTDKSGNEKFAAELSKWTFQERGHLRLRDLKHHKKGELDAPAVYRILDNVTFSVVIEEWSGDKWVPYQADDVQVEFTMLDPYVRRNLKADANGVFSLDFVIPDVYGIFKFHLDYHRFGYTSLFAETLAPVRPFKHNEYERFISSAFPYYASAFSMLAGIFLFSVVFVFHKDKKQ
jgi:oligosaccharyltransferase complex subunit beta